MSLQVMYISFQKHNLVNPRALQEKERHKYIIKELFLKKNIQIEYDDNTDCLIDDDIGEGDYVMENVTKKARVVRYIARIDEVNDGKYEGAFLHKVFSCLKDDYISFTSNEKDDASFFCK